MLLEFEWLQVSLSSSGNTTAWSDLFPADIARSVAALGVHEMAITLGTRGWRSKQWGALPLHLDVPDGSTVDVIWEHEASSGARGGSAVRPTLQLSLERRWRMLLRWASGLVCHSLATGLGADDDLSSDASIVSRGLAGESGPLSHMDHGRGGTKRAWYTLSHGPGPALLGGGGGGLSRARHTLSVPGGGACTESLHAAIVRTLPCRRHTGLAAVALSPRALAASPFRMLSLSVHPAAACLEGRARTGGAGCPMELRSTLAYVALPPIQPVTKQSASDVQHPLPPARLLDILSWGDVLWDAAAHLPFLDECPAVSAPGQAVIRVRAMRPPSYVNDGSANGGARYSQGCRTEGVQDSDDACIVSEHPLSALRTLLIDRRLNETVAGVAPGLIATTPAGAVAIRRSVHVHHLGSGTMVFAIERQGTAKVMPSAATEGDDIHARLLVVLPWFVVPTAPAPTVWRHGGACTTSGAAPVVEVSGNGSSLLASRTNWSSFRAAIARGQPGVAALALSLPPCSTTYVALPYAMPLMHADECPPDTHRGLQVPSSALVLGASSAVLALQTSDWPWPLLAGAVHGPGNGVDAIQGTWLFTASVVLEPPAPDFSMAFNVMTLVMTVFAFVAGSILNVTGRKRSEWSQVSLQTPTH